MDVYKLVSQPRTNNFKIDSDKIFYSCVANDNYRIPYKLNEVSYRVPNTIGLMAFSDINNLLEFFNFMWSDIEHPAVLLCKGFYKMPEPKVWSTSFAIDNLDQYYEEKYWKVNKNSYLPYRYLKRANPHNSVLYDKLKPIEILDVLPNKIIRRYDLYTRPNRINGIKNRRL